ncbi:MAG TPA: hypothetical protein VME45_10740 [Stellaceae bacterium]|nr:hypothetical protein [Stellaceae bacterium]
MPALTIYLSRLMGMVMLIIAAAMLTDKAMVVTAIGYLGQDRAALLVLGLVRVTLGAGIVLIHNVWTKGFWPLLVTLCGWALLVRGVLVLFVPPDVIAGFIEWSRVIDFYYLYAAIPLVLGGYLALRGFSTSAPPIEVPGLPTAAPLTKPQRAKTRPNRRH